MIKETINTFAFDPVEFPFNIEVSGITECDEVYITKRSNSYCYILEYILKGSGTLICDGKTYSVSKGDIYLLSKGSNHQYYPSKTDPWTKIWFNIDGILIPSLMVSYGLQNSVIFKKFNDPSLFHELFNLTSSEEPKKTIMNNAAFIFHRIMSKLNDLMTEGSIKNSVNAIKEIIDANIYENNFSLSMVSKQLCVSQSHIINIFKKVYNQTPYQYMVSQRIKIACSMLLNTQMTINEIADILNFSDQHYFTNAFKRVMGITPSEFRKTNSSDYISRSNKNIKNADGDEGPQVQVF